MLGETNPMDSKPGTIRGDLCVQVGRYICTVLISPADRKGQWCVMVWQSCAAGCPPWGSVAVCRDGERAAVLTVTETLSKAGTACSVPACCCLTITYNFCVQWRPLKNGVCFALRLEITLLLYQSFPRNIIHGSDSLESAEAEINLWFTPEELVEYRSCAHEWIYE